MPASRIRTPAKTRRRRIRGMMPTRYVRAVDDLLLAWFAENGRDLPWRRTRDPYAILVSEVMSQQTQVERVVPRWQRWLERWPTVGPLAADCPSRGRRFEPSCRQGPFEGSFRQRRAAALRAVLAGSHPRDAEAVAALARDGLVRLDGDAVSLPE